MWRKEGSGLREWSIPGRRESNRECDQGTVYVECSIEEASSVVHPVQNWWMWIWSYTTVSMGVSALSWTGAGSEPVCPSRKRVWCILITKEPLFFPARKIPKLHHWESSSPALKCSHLWGSTRQQFNSAQRQGKTGSDDEQLNSFGYTCRMCKTSQV